MNIIIPFDSRSIVDDYGVMEYMIYALESKDSELPYRYIEEITDDCFEVQSELDAEIMRLVEIVDNNLPTLTPLILPLIEDKVINNRVTIEEVSPFGYDTLIVLSEAV